MTIRINGVPATPTSLGEIVADLNIASSAVSFTQSGTGAVARTVQAKLRDTISVRDFGAVGEGTTNDAAAIQAAIDAVAAMGGGCVELPEVTRINSSITISSPNITLTGRGAGGTRLILGNATMNAIVLKGADIRSIEISHLQAESATVGGQTAGSFISLERHTGGQGCFDVKVSYITTFNMWRFLSTHASTQTPATVFLDVHINQVVLRDMKYRGFDLTMMAGLKLDQYTISYADPQTVAPAASSAGIYLGDWIDGYWIGNGNILGGEVCFDMGSDWASNGRKPAQGQVWGLSADTGWQQSVRLRDLKTCEFHGLITGNLSGGTNPGGVVINGSGASFTATDGVDGARFYGGKDANCLGTGFTISGQSRNVYCYGREFISNGRASASGALNNAYVGVNMTKFGFTNCTFDVDTAWFGANAAGYALLIDTGCNDYILGPNIYNASAHFTGGLFNGSSGAANKSIIAGLA
jgi:hypothetical protein